MNQLKKLRIEILELESKKKELKSKILKVDDTIYKLHRQSVAIKRLLNK